MSDNKSLRGPADRSRISANEPYEVNYAAGQLAREFPTKSHAEIRKAVVDSAHVPQFHNNRQMVMNSARLKLRS